MRDRAPALPQVVRGLLRRMVRLREMPWERVARFALEIVVSQNSARKLMFCSLLEFPRKMA